MDIEWTKEESELLFKKGLYTVGQYTTTKNGITLEKYTIYNKIKYRSGVEGTAYDCDGDLGWCRTWTTYDDLGELLKNNKI